MKKNVVRFCGLWAMAFCLACTSNTTSREESSESARLVGNDPDDHGCIASAGYQWSELLRDCIRPFEKGVQLVSATEADATFAAYLVFNADSSKVELYVPNMEQHPILSKREPTVWGASGEGKMCVKNEGGTWKVLAGEKALYVTPSAE